MKKLLLLSCLLLGILSSCSDDYTVKTRTDYLTTDKWFIEYATVSTNIEGQNQTQSLLDFLPHCAMDNYLTFLPDGTIAMDENLCNCENSPANSVIGNWQLVDNSRTFRGTLPGVPVNVDLHILQLDGKYLKLQWDGQQDGIPATFFVMYSHMY